MRFTLVDGFLADEEGGRLEEGQTIEFKMSISASCQREAIRSLVAFANSIGGRVFFGVRNDGLVKGVQPGQDTLEHLAAKVARLTYPSLPPSIDIVEVDRRCVVVVEVPGDTPPVVGVYLISKKSIAPDKPVKASDLQTFRRVGRMDQKEDFMRLRQPQPSDPKVRIRVGKSSAGYYRNNESISFFECPVWTEEGSATAHAIRLYLNPGLFVSEEMVEDLPRPGKEGFVGVERLQIRSVPTTNLLMATEISSVYLDDWGFNWKVSRGIRMTDSEGEQSRWIDVEDRGVFTRRIVEFPPKVQVMLS